MKLNDDRRGGNFGYKLMSNTRTFFGFQSFDQFFQADVSKISVTSPREENFLRKIGEEKG